jgi:hypothetical protein
MLKHWKSFSMQTAKPQKLNSTLDTGHKSHQDKECSMFMVKKRETFDSFNFVNVPAKVTQLIANVTP